MKVRFAGKDYDVKETKERFGVTWYAIEDEPGSIDWLNNVEIIEEDEENDDNGDSQ